MAAMLDFAKGVLQHVWSEFINHFDAEANVDQLFSKELIDESMMEVILKNKSTKDANRAFLLYLSSNATIESLWKLCELLRDTARYHERHDSLATLLEDELKQWKVPLSSPVAVQKGGRGGDEPSSSQSITSELTDTVISDEDAALRLGIVAAPDLDEGASQQTFTDEWLAKDPPHRRLHDAYIRLQSRLAKLCDEHIDDLKPFFHICQKNEEGQCKLLKVEDIDAAKSVQTIFNKICNCWLNTEIFIRLIRILPDKKSHDKAKQHLETYHELLGVFCKFVLLKHIPEDDARLDHFRSRMFPKLLRIRYDVDIEDFAVSKLLKQQEFLCRIFKIPKEAFRYLEATEGDSVDKKSRHVSEECCRVLPQMPSPKPLFQDSVPLSEPGVQERTWPSDGTGLSSFGPIGRTVMEQLSDSKDSTEQTNFVPTPLVSCHDDHSNRDESGTPNSSDLDSTLTDKPLNQIDVSASGVKSQLPSSTEIPSEMDGNLASYEDHCSDISEVGEPSQRLSGSNGKLNEQDNEGRTPLHRAVGSGNVEAVKALLNLGARPSLTTVAGMEGTPLHLAVANGHEEIVSVLLDAGCPVDVVNRVGHTALHWASTVKGNVDLIHLLIKHDSKVNEQDYGGRTPLHRAATNGNVEEVKALLSLGAGPSLTKVAGTVEGTPLHQAVGNDHKEIVSVLLDAGCPVDVVDSKGKTALYWALASGNIDLIHFLIKHGSKVVNEQDNDDGLTPLNREAARGNVEVVKALLSLGAGPSLTKVDGEYGTPLHQAVAKGHKEIVSVLLDAGCPVDVVERNGQTALHCASLCGCVDLIPFLINHGSKVVNEQDTDDGLTPLHCAALSGNVEAVKALLSLGAGPSLTKIAGGRGTPLHLAAGRGHKDIVSVLLDAGCPVDVVDRDGQTALHHACLHGDVDLIRILSKYGSESKVRR